MYNNEITTSCEPSTIHPDLGSGNELSLHQHHLRSGPFKFTWQRYIESDLEIMIIHYLNLSDVDVRIIHYRNISDVDVMIINYLHLSDVDVMIINYLNLSDVDVMIIHYLNLSDVDVSALSLCRLRYQ